MGGTKIIVLQMKELIRTVIFAVIGLILIVALVYFFLPKGDKVSKKNDIYTPGTYTSQIILQDNTPIDINVTVSNKEIIELKLTELSDEQVLLYPLLQPTFEDLSTEIVNKQSINVNLNKNDSITKQVLLEAIKLAVNKAVDTSSI